MIAAEPTSAGMISLPSEQPSALLVATAPSAATSPDERTAAAGEPTGAPSETPSLSLLDLVLDQERYEAARHTPLAGAGIRALQEVSTNWQPNVDEIISQPASSLAVNWSDLSKELAVDEPRRRPAGTVRVVEPTSFFLLLLGLAGFGLHCLQKARTGLRRSTC